MQCTCLSSFSVTEEMIHFYLRSDGLLSEGVTSWETLFYPEQRPYGSLLSVAFLHIRLSCNISAMRSCSFSAPIMRHIGSYGRLKHRRFSKYQDDQIFLSIVGSLFAVLEIFLAAASFHPHDS